MSLSIDATLKLCVENVERKQLNGVWRKGKFIEHAEPTVTITPSLVAMFIDREGYEIDRAELPLTELKAALDKLDSPR